jgi:hypothetical protein
MALEKRDATQLVSWAPPLPQRAFQITAAGVTSAASGLGGTSVNGQQYGYFLLNTGQWQTLSTLNLPPVNVGERFQLCTSAVGSSFEEPPAFITGNVTGGTTTTASIAAAPDLFNVAGMFLGKQYSIKDPTLCAVVSTRQNSTNSWYVYYTPYNPAVTVNPVADGFVTVPELSHPKWLGQLGHVAGINYSYSIPGGPDQLTCVLQVEPYFRTDAMNPGRIITAHRGGSCIWEGILTEPQPAATGWTLNANGVGTYGTNYAAWWQVSNPASWEADRVVDYAIARGLRWSNLGIGSPAGLYLGPVQESGSMTITDFLNLLCFTAGTPVVTNRGVIGIEDVRKNDRVLTHRGRWRRVTRTVSREARVVTDGLLTVTPDHLFWHRASLQEPPGWTPAGKTTGEYVALPSKADRLPIPRVGGRAFCQDGSAFWYMAGRWAGDGWLCIRDAAAKPRRKRASYSPEPRLCANGCGNPARKGKRGTGYTAYCSDLCGNKAVRPEWRERPRHDIFICCAHEEAADLERQLTETGLSWLRSEARTTTVFQASHKELSYWLRDNFGEYAHGKTVPGWLFGAGDNVKKSWLAGYTDADGSRRADGEIRTSSVSRNLSTGIRILASTLGYNTSMYRDKRAGSAVIESRQIVQRESWHVSIWGNRAGSTADDGLHRWVKQRRPWTEAGTQRVYDITVAEDESFVAGAHVVHNCTGGALSWQLVQPPGAASFPPAEWQLNLFPLPTDSTGNPIQSAPSSTLASELFTFDRWSRADLSATLSRRPPDLYIINTSPIPRTITADINTVVVYYEVTADTTATSTTAATTATYQTTFADIPGSVAIHGRLEYFLDVSSAGVMTQPQASAIAANVLNKYIRANFSGSFTVQPGQLVNVGGFPVDLGCNWGGYMASLQVESYAFGGEVGFGPITFQIGEYVFDDDTQTATVTPFQNARTDMSSVIAQLYPGRFALQPGYAGVGYTHVCSPQVPRPSARRRIRQRHSYRARPLPPSRRTAELRTRCRPHMRLRR